MNHRLESWGTIVKEIQRNSDQRGYRYNQAQKKAVQSRKEANGVPRKMTPELISLIWEESESLLETYRGML